MSNVVIFNQTLVSASKQWIFSTSFSLSCTRSHLLINIFCLFSCWKTIRAEKTKNINIGSDGNQFKIIYTQTHTHRILIYEIHNKYIGWKVQTGRSNSNSSARKTKRRKPSAGKSICAFSNTIHVSATHAVNRLPLLTFVFFELYITR